MSGFFQDWQYRHANALFLALASSTDNFLVGLSISLSKQRRLTSKLLWGIAICNALGCLVATEVGSTVLSSFTTSSSSSLPMALAGCAFAYLAWKDYSEWNNNDSIMPLADKGRPKEKEPISDNRELLELALPMTLNNLAGGVAGGVMGVSAMTASLYALAVSVATMWTGSQLGKIHVRRPSSRQNNSRMGFHRRQATKKDDDNRHEEEDLTSTAATTTGACWSVLLYALLSAQSFYEALSSLS